MAQKRSPIQSKQDHRFGGDWTQTKLDVIEKYLSAYTTALKKQPFSKAYIDAFAGTGYRSNSRVKEELDATELLFPELAEPEPQELRDGSARIALKTSPPFDRYIFIEQSPDRCAALEALKDEFPTLSNAIKVRQGEANHEIRQLCELDWSERRAVLFLDPYGMQVEWRTLEAIARTKAIDLWLLFPLGAAVNRMITRSGKISEAWRSRLNLLFGTSDWEEACYQTASPPSQGTLFSAQPAPKEKVPIEQIGRYFFERLKTLFPEGAVSEPVALKNSANCPLYLLWFAASNERGARVALKIAKHILNGVR